MAAKEWFEPTPAGKPQDPEDPAVAKMLDRAKDALPAGDPLDATTVARLIAPVDRGNDGWKCSACEVIYTPGDKRLSLADFTCTNAVPERRRVGGDPNRCRGRLLAINQQSNHSLWHEMTTGVAGAPNVPAVQELAAIKALADVRLAPPARDAGAVAAQAARLR